MKKYETIYSDTGVTYWPIYKTGKISIFYFSLMATACVITALFILFDNATSESKILGAVFAVAVIILSLILNRHILKTMYTKYDVTVEGVAFTNSRTKEEKRIKWQDVSAVQFKKDIWYGREKCIISLKNPDIVNKVDEIKLPISVVDTKKLLYFIPKDLWKNNPLDVF